MNDIRSWLMEYAYRADDRVTVLAKRKRQYFMTKYRLGDFGQLMVLVLLWSGFVRAIRWSGTTDVEVLFGRELTLFVDLAYSLFFDLGALLVGIAFLKWLHARLEPVLQPEMKNDHGNGYTAWAVPLAILMQMAVLILLVDARAESILEALSPLTSLPWMYHFLAIRKGPDKPRKKREVRVEATETVRERFGKIAPRPI